MARPSAPGGQTRLGAQTCVLGSHQTVVVRFTADDRLVPKASGQPRTVTESVPRIACPASVTPVSTTVVSALRRPRITPRITSNPTTPRGAAESSIHLSIDRTGL